ncbi:hypothetical protein [Streptomyces sp. NPDC002825]|uniref:hypothetical protein n=1 Tax=Streptomyces sp. NPDC002825 TaxID=3154666 RepID=UPI0033230F24
MTWDIVRAVVFGFRDELPEWVRYSLLALGCTLLVHQVLDWLRERFGAPLEESEAHHESGEADQESEADVR